MTKGKKLLIRVASFLAGALMLTLGTGVRGGAQAGQLDSVWYPLGWVVTLVGLVLVFVVFFVWEPTRMGKPATKPGDDGTPTA